MNIKFEKEVLELFSLPSIPKKEWDCESSFSEGLAVAEFIDKTLGYVVVSYDAETQKKPAIKRVFDLAQIKSIDYSKVLIIPEYMDIQNTEKWDLDEDSKKKAEAIIEEVKDLEGKEKQKDVIEYEWVFPEIHNLEEAEAWVKHYRKTNKIKGKIPMGEDAIKNYLLVVNANMKRGIK